jgi:hypothetical protein
MAPQVDPKALGPATLDPNLKDPLVAVLTERVADLIVENRELRHEVDFLENVVAWLRRGGSG